MDYVEARTSGNAWGHLEARRKPNALKPFVNVEEMYNVLERVYGDRNCQQTAMTKFRALAMRGQDFNTFWLEFQRLAAELDHNDTTLISKLTHKLAPGLQRQLAIGEKQPTYLYKYAEQCQHAYNAMKDAERNQAAHNQFESRRSTPTTYSKPTLVASTPKAFVPTSPNRYSRPVTPNQNEPRLTQEELTLLRQQDRCF